MTLYFKKKTTLNPLHTRLLCTKFAKIILGFERLQSHQADRQTLDKCDQNRLFEIYVLIK